MLASRAISVSRSPCDRSVSSVRAVSATSVKHPVGGKAELVEQASEKGIVGCEGAEFGLPFGREQKPRMIRAQCAERFGPGGERKSGVHEEDAEEETAEGGHGGRMRLG